MAYNWHVTRASWNVPARKGRGLPLPSPQAQGLLVALGQPGTATFIWGSGTAASRQAQWPVWTDPGRGGEGSTRAPTALKLGTGSPQRLPQLAAAWQGHVHTPRGSLTAARGGPMEVRVQVRVRSSEGPGGCRGSALQCPTQRGGPAAAGGLTPALPLQLPLFFPFPETLIFHSFFTPSQISQGRGQAVGGVSSGLPAPAPAWRPVASREWQAPPSPPTRTGLRANPGGERHDPAHCCAALERGPGPLLLGHPWSPARLQPW